MNINIEEVKQYNANLRKYRDMSSKLQAEKQFLLTEIENECKALAELGVEVNSSNIQQVKDDLCNKINSSLQSGNAVLAKIASETQAQIQSTTANNQFNRVPQVQTQSSMEKSIAQNSQVPPQPLAQPTPANPASVFQGFDTGGFNGADSLGSLFE